MKVVALAVGGKMMTLITTENVQRPKMNNNVTSLETAKKLKAAGFPQDGTAYMWVKWELSDWLLLPSDVGSDIELATLSGKRTDTIAAPTAQEIIDELPEYLPNNDAARFTITAHAFSGQICAMYFDESYSLDDDDGVVECECANTLAEALAKLWLEI